METEEIVQLGINVLAGAATLGATVIAWRALVLQHRDGVQRDLRKLRVVHSAVRHAQLHLETARKLWHEYPDLPALTKIDRIRPSLRRALRRLSPCQATLDGIVCGPDGTALHGTVIDQLRLTVEQSGKLRKPGALTQTPEEMAADMNELLGELLAELNTIDTGLSARTTKVVADLIRLRG